MDLRYYLSTPSSDDFKKKANPIKIWKDLEALFRDNKDTKRIQFDNELCKITISNSTITNAPTITLISKPL